jgi:hypothetical protein
VAISTTKNTYIRWRKTVSTVKKSQARTPEAWARRNVVQDAPVRRGAGSTPARRRIRDTVAAGTR